MRKICSRCKNWIQVASSRGEVRICGWLSRYGLIGNLVDNTLPELYHGKHANEVRERLANQDYSYCDADGCPMLMEGTIKDYLEDYGELPEYPEELQIGFENECNYRCESCMVCCINDGLSPEQMERNKDIIEERIREALPYVKHIGANGAGEFFCSKRTLKLLSEWKPLAPAEECTVLIETNGSLFDEEHWKQVENLGNYHLSVVVTVLSFDEPTYQRLSGVKYPIKKIEDNLRFVKSLREKGIINELCLGTVVYADNFREMPEFSRRCLEEFGADVVRLRPYANWGAQDEVAEFLMDIRNPKHPWYPEYKDMLKDPIFKNPKVMEQSGGQDTDRHRALPYERGELKYKMTNRMLEDPDRVIKSLPKEDFIMYGFGHLTKNLISIMKKEGISPACILDKNKPSGEYEGIPVYNLCDAAAFNGKEMPVIITVLEKFPKMQAMLRDTGFEGRIIPVWELVENDDIAGRLQYICKWGKY